MTSNILIFDFAEIRKRLEEMNVDPIFPVEKEPEPEKKDDTNGTAGSTADGPG